MKRIDQQRRAALDELARRVDAEARRGTPVRAQTAARPAVLRATQATRLYWAYGSNLCVAAMQRRCPEAVKFKRLYVRNGLLTFRGVADVEHSEQRDHAVPGGLWWVTAACEQSLDGYEGVRSGLYVKRYLTLRVEGETVRCLYYKMTLDGVMPPWGVYLDTLAEGYRDFKLDLSLLSEAVDRSWSDKERTADLTRRWLARGKPRLARSLEKRR